MGALKSNFKLEDDLRFGTISAKGILICRLGRGELVGKGENADAKSTGYEIHERGPAGRRAWIVPGGELCLGASPFTCASAADRSMRSFTSDSRSSHTNTSTYPGSAGRYSTLGTAQSGQPANRAGTTGIARSSPAGAERQGSGERLSDSSPGFS